MISMILIECISGQGMVDRVLVSAHAQNLKVVLVLNKAEELSNSLQPGRFSESPFSAYKEITDNIGLAFPNEGRSSKEQ